MMTEKKTLAVHVLEKFVNDRERMDRYSALVCLCPLPAFIIATDRNSLIFINPAYEQLTGRRLEDLQQDKWIELVIHPDDQAEVRERWRIFTTTQTDGTPHRHRYVHVSGIVTDAITLVERIENNGYVGFILPLCESSQCPILQLNKLVPPARISLAT